MISDINLVGEVTGVALCTDLAARHPHLRLALTTALPVTAPLRQEGAAQWPVLPKPLSPAALDVLMANRGAA